MSGKRWFHKIERSAFWTTLGVIVLFSFSIFVTLLAPSHIDPSWKHPSCEYQAQMYENMDPHFYISTKNPGGWGPQFVYHLKEGRSLHAFQETETMRILAPKELESYVTHLGDTRLKLTTKNLLLKETTPDKEKEGSPQHEIYQLFDPQKEELFVLSESEAIIENWAPEGFQLIGKEPPYAIERGAIYIKNPKEYTVIDFPVGQERYWLYKKGGVSINTLSELKKNPLGFLSRQELIQRGEEIYKIEGCWYCHTDQTRTLIQDTVLNSCPDFPAPPSSANEYIYQKVTFPGTRRIGPDLSRTGIIRPGRDWHMSHFWSPQDEIEGSLMPPFRHFFDADPSGHFHNIYGVPNVQFEAMFQYLMTKGTRITSPDQAWWEGKDPLQTLKIIEGREDKVKNG